MRISMVVVALGVLGVVFLATGPGPHAQKVEAHDFIGAGQCRTCHQAEYDIWAKGPHARSLEGLSDKERRDPRCLSCHTMTVSDKDPDLAGVQCETCHGPGRYYAKEHIMRDEVLRQQLMFEAIDASTCARCHTDNSPALTPFLYEAALSRIRHWPDEPAPAPSGK